MLTYTVTCCGIQFWHATLVTELVVCVIVFTIVVAACVVDVPVWVNEFDTTLVYVVVPPPRAVNVTVDNP